MLISAARVTQSVSANESVHLWEIKIAKSWSHGEAFPLRGAATTHCSILRLSHPEGSGEYSQGPGLG